jgi:hypothetical protein
VLTQGRVQRGSILGKAPRSREECRALLDTVRSGWAVVGGARGLDWVSCPMHSQRLAECRQSEPSRNPLANAYSSAASTAKRIKVIVTDVKMVYLFFDLVTAGMWSYVRPVA